MAKTAMKLKQQRKPKFSTQAYTRCNICGRPHSVLRKYGICRLCFRDLVSHTSETDRLKTDRWELVLQVTHILISRLLPVQASLRRLSRMSGELRHASRASASLTSVVGQRV